MIGQSTVKFRVPSDIEYNLAKDWAELRGNKLSSIGAVDFGEISGFGELRIQLDNGKEYTLIIDIDTIINVSEIK